MGSPWDCVAPLGAAGTSPITDLEFWNGELYACGSFTYSGTTSVNFIARFDGTAWQPLGLGADAIVAGLRAMPDGLYAAGWFNQIDTVEALGLARWDGTRWYPVHDLPDITSVQASNAIGDVAEYNGMLYIAGNFAGPLGNNIARWNGTAWEGLNGGNGFLGSLGWVYRLEVHDGLLYMAGLFSTGSTGHPNNPGNGIVAFDGTDWYDLGGGTAGSVNHAVNEMLWWHDTLYIAGSFNMIGGVPTDGLARWDGNQWCSLVPPDYFDLPNSVIGLYHDSLFVGGTFMTAGGDSIARIAKWIGGNYTTGCGALSTEEQQRPDEQMRVWPNPATDHLDVRWSDFGPDMHLKLYNALGQLVLQGSPGSTTLNVQGIRPGAYLILVADDRGISLARQQVLIE